MTPAKAVLKVEPTDELAERINRSPQILSGQIPPRLPNALAGIEPSRPLSTAYIPAAVPTARPRRDTGALFQPRVPIVTGEATFRGWMPVDGMISGQLGASGSTLSIKQRPRGGPVEKQPELTGEITFKDMLRVNGHFAGKVSSQKGTLIVDASALVDGDIDVGVVVISGTVNGDVVGHERVELGPASIINGNISTRTLTMKPGAVFQGDCRMLKNGNGDK